jgi:peptidyl-prolyl cis-trans isomerase C
MAQATARHILVSSDELCRKLMSQLRNGAEFGLLAAQHSTCPSARNGGNLGSFEPGKMVPEFDRVAFSAPLHTVHGPVHSRFGYHIIEVLERD